MPCQQRVGWQPQFIASDQAGIRRAILAAIAAHGIVAAERQPFRVRLRLIGDQPGKLARLAEAMRQVRHAADVDTHGDIGVVVDAAPVNEAQSAAVILDSTPPDCP